MHVDGRSNKPQDYFKPSRPSGQKDKKPSTSEESEQVNQSDATSLGERQPVSADLHPDRDPVNLSQSEAHEENQPIGDAALRPPIYENPFMNFPPPMGPFVSNYTVNPYFGH